MEERIPRRGRDLVLGGGKVLVPSVTCYKQVQVTHFLHGSIEEDRWFGWVEPAGDLSGHRRQRPR